MRLSWPSRLVIGAAIAVAIVGAVRGLPDKEEREAPRAAPCPSWAARKRHRSRRRRDHAGERRNHDHSLVGIDLGEHFLAPA
jgi:hypothetical protein